MHIAVVLVVGLMPCVLAQTVSNTNNCVIWKIKDCSNKQCNNNPNRNRFLDCFNSKQNIYQNMVNCANKLGLGINGNNPCIKVHIDRADIEASLPQGNPFHDYVDCMVGCVANTVNSCFDGCDSIPRGLPTGEVFLTTYQRGVVVCKKRQLQPDVNTAVNQCANP